MARKDTAPTRLFSQERPGYADVGEVESVAGTLSEKHLLCRELQHNWLPYGTPGRYRDGGFKRIVRCQRCKTERHMEIDARGLVDSSHYVYPDGYLVEGLGRIVGEARGALRLASITRAWQQDGVVIPELTRKGEPEPVKPVKPTTAKGRGKTPAKRTSKKGAA